MRYLTVELAVAVNLRETAQYGGVHGIRDKDRLIAAIDRVYSGYLIHPGQQAATILQSIAHDHPFLDGNKRTAYALMQVILRSFGLHLVATEQQKFDLVMDAVKGKDVEELFAWIMLHIEQLLPKD